MNEIQIKCAERKNNNTKRPLKYLFTTHVSKATNATWMTVFSGYQEHSTELSSSQSAFLWLFFFFHCCCITKDAETVRQAFSVLLTLVACSVFDDDSPSAARLLLSLGHALASLIIRVISSVDGHLLLNHSEACQLLCTTESTGRETVSTERIQPPMQQAGC